MSLYTENRIDAKRVFFNNTGLWATNFEILFEFYLNIFQKNKAAPYTH